MEALPPGDEPNVDVDYERIDSLASALDGNGDSPHTPIEDSDVGQTEFEHDSPTDVGDNGIAEEPRANDLGYPEGRDPSTARDCDDDLWVFDSDTAYVRADEDTAIEDVRNER